MYILLNEGKKIKKRLNILDNSYFLSLFIKKRFDDLIKKNYKKKRFIKKRIIKIKFFIF